VLSGCPGQVHGDFSSWQVAFIRIRQVVLPSKALKEQTKICPGPEKFES